MALEGTRFKAHPKREHRQKGREGGGGGQSPAATKEKSSPGGRASHSNLDEAANETENTEDVVFQNLRERNVPRRGEQLVV